KRARQAEPSLEAPVGLIPGRPLRNRPRILTVNFQDARILGSPGAKTNPTAKCCYYSSRPNRASPRRLNQTLNHLRHLRQWLRLAQESVCSRSPRFLFYLLRAIRGKHDDPCIRVSFVNQFYDLDPVRVSSQSQSQILNNHLVLCGL